ncbi:MAG: hypothetical protein ACOCQA_00665, partial [bacterium]
EVKEINKLISKEDLMNELIGAVNSQNKALIDKGIDKVTDKLDKQERAIQELTEEVKQLKNRTILDKIKDFFNSQR